MTATGWGDYCRLGRKHGVGEMGSRVLLPPAGEPVLGVHQNGGYKKYSRHYEGQHYPPFGLHDDERPFTNLSEHKDRIRVWGPVRGSACNKIIRSMRPR
jgi:hypothetical protein